MKGIVSPMLFGLTLWQAWWLALGNSDLAVSKGVEWALWGLNINAFTLVYASMALGYLAMALWAARVKRPLTSYRRAPLATAAVASSGTVLLVLVNGALPSPATTVATVAASALVAGGNVAIMCLWGELWGSLRTSRVGLIALASYVFAFVFLFVILAIPRPVGTVVLCLLPALSSYVFLFALKEPRREQVTQESFPSGKIIARVFVFLFTVSAAHGFTQASPHLSDPSSINIYMFVDFGILAAILVYLVVRTPEYEAPILFRLVQFVLCAGLVALATNDATLQAVGNGMFLAGIHGLEMIVFLVVSDICFRSGRSIAFSLSLCFFGLRVGSVCVHIAFSLLEALDPSVDDIFSWGTRLALVALLCLGFVVLSDQAFNSLFVRKPPVRTKTPAIASNCAAIASRYGLTPRELEILELVAQGRTNPYIAKELSISANTARNHVSNIYRKVGVYDRQQLLDIINGK